MATCPALGESLLGPPEIWQFGDLVFILWLCRTKTFISTGKTMPRAKEE